jgi:hypothetical protein
MMFTAVRLHAEVDAEACLLFDFGEADRLVDERLATQRTSTFDKIANSIRVKTRAAGEGWLIDQ